MGWVGWSGRDRGHSGTWKCGSGAPGVVDPVELQGGFPQDVVFLVVEEFPGYCQLVETEAANGKQETGGSQSAVAAPHSLKERSRNSR